MTNCRRPYARPPAQPHPPVLVVVSEPSAERPDGADPGPIDERLAGSIRHAASRGMVLASVRLAFVPQPSPVPPEAWAKSVLKHALRANALKARWPGPEPKRRPK